MSAKHTTEEIATIDTEAMSSITGGLLGFGGRDRCAKLWQEYYGNPKATLEQYDRYAKQCDYR